MNRDCHGTVCATTQTKPIASQSSVGTQTEPTTIGSKPTTSTSSSSTRALTQNPDDIFEATLASIVQSSRILADYDLGNPDVIASDETIEAVLGLLT